MDNGTRLRYLEAMGIDVWVPRSIEAIAPEQPFERRPTESITWEQLEQAVSVCSSCERCQLRSQFLLGEGNRQADWMIIASTPTINEHQTPKVMTGYAEQLLNEMLRAIGLNREQVYLAPLLKCLTVSAVDADQAQADSCREFLHQQIQLVQPKIILLMGEVAARLLLQTNQKWEALRQQAHQLQNVPLIVLNHPEHLLLSMLDKKTAWLDLQRALRLFRSGEE